MDQTNNKENNQMTIATTEELLDKTSDVIITQDILTNNYRVYQRQSNGKWYMAIVTPEMGEAISKQMEIMEENYEKQLREAITI